MKLNFFFILSIFLSIFGCASNSIRADKIQLAKIKSVSISKQILVPNSGMYFNDQTVKMGALVGGAAGRLVVALADPAPVQIAKSMQANNISVEHMLRDKFIKKLT